MAVPNQIDALWLIAGEFEGKFKMAIKVVKNWGVCRKNEFPYSELVGSICEEGAVQLKCWNW